MRTGVLCIGNRAASQREAHPAKIPDGPRCNAFVPYGDQLPSPGAGDQPVSAPPSSSFMPQISTEPPEQPK